MKRYAKDKEEFYDLFRYFNFLIAGHFFTAFIVMLDIMLSISLFDLQTFDWLKCVMNKDTLISSLLVVWTFITAILVFYMERRGNRYYGVRIWDIVAFKLKKWQKILACIFFFLELILIQIGTIFDFLFTLVWLIFLYTITAGCVLWFVVKATTEQVLRTNLKAILRTEYVEFSHVKSKECMQQYLEELPYGKEKELDFLTEVLTDEIVYALVNYSSQELWQMQEVLYKLMYCILEKLREHPLKRLFICNLAKRAGEKLEMNDNFLSVLYALALPALEKMDSTWPSLYIDFVSVLKFKDKREFNKKMLFGGLVFTFYLERNTEEGRQRFAQQEILNYLGNVLSKEERDYIINFVQQLNCRCQKNQSMQMLTEPEVHLEQVLALFDNGRSFNESDE